MFIGGCEGDVDSSGLGELQDSISFDIDLSRANEDNEVDVEFDSIVLGRFAEL